MLEARAVTVERRGRKLLDDVYVKVPPGRVTAIVGANGSGKSTLMKALAGEMKPCDGDVLLDGRNLKAFTAADLARRRAMVPQATSLSFPFIVIEVVRLGASVPGFDAITTRAHAIAEEALLAVDLAAAWADELIVLKSGRVLARGAPAAVFNDALLSEAYGCPIRTNATPAPGTPYLLPQPCTSAE